MDKRLPDTPWHIGYAKKDEEDPRRHKSRCIFYRKDKTCKCGKSPYYMFNCGGSAHCRYYKENEEQNSEKVEQDAKLKKQIKRAERAAKSNKNSDQVIKKTSKKWSVDKIVVVKSGDNCPSCGKPNQLNSRIKIIDDTGCSYVIQVKKCECGDIYLTDKLKKELPSGIKGEIVKGVISLRKRGLKITSYDPDKNDPVIKMIICPKCKSKCNSLFGNKGMCWKCYKKKSDI